MFVYIFQLTACEPPDLFIDINLVTSNHLELLIQINYNQQSHHHDHMLSSEVLPEREREEKNKRAGKKITSIDKCSQTQLLIFVLLRGVST